MDRPATRWPSPAMIVALFALTLSMGGGVALAAKHYLITSTNQISPKVLTKLKGTQGPQGTRGPQGTQGPQGAKGDAGGNGTNGVAVIQRTTGSGTPGDSGAVSSITLANASFSNPSANTDNLFFAKATFTAPATCTTVPPGEEPFISSGGLVDSTTHIFGGGGPFTPGEPASTMELGQASLTAPGVGPHTLTLEFETNCTGSGQTGTITNIELDTAAVG
jgi:hypothetical protein